MGSMTKILLIVVPNRFVSNYLLGHNCHHTMQIWMIYYSGLSFLICSFANFISVFLMFVIFTLASCSKRCHSNPHSSERKNEVLPAMDAMASRWQVDV